MYAPHPPTTPSFPNTLCLNSGIIGIYNEDGIAVGGYKYNAWGQLCKTWNEAGYEDIVNLNPFRYRGYYFDTDVYRNCVPEKIREITADIRGVNSK